MIERIKRLLRIRKWRNYWQGDRFISKQIRHSKYLSVFFNFERSYRLIKLFARVDQERGKI
ncbi:hypothetical protein CKY04_23835 [Photorhabdus sp. S8-52]|nr:hypothetical protein CKY03_23835 [Photorhabdus sp. S9-53]RAW91792.1 hypothetical protein CKY05_23800 [Photorhabdus sp. S10-54]RAW95343.1 hypothetical protein CKY04_23835 [Photorhabdus sp. S8-52]